MLFFLRKYMIRNSVCKKIYVKSYGCQMNVYDSNRIIDLFKPKGFEKTLDILEADIIVLNTCHIREKATEKVYHDIGRLKKNYKNKKKPIVLVTGCVAQAENVEMLKREPYIDAVVGPQSYHKLPKILSELKRSTKKINFTDFDVVQKFDELNTIKNSDSNVSSFITIQEGCDKFCNFCVVPYTRGAEHSRSLEEIINEAKNLVSNGIREITLLGQNVNAYKYSSNKKIIKLSDLIYELQDLENLKRIRYTTSHPKDVTSDLIDCHNKVKKLMPLLHLPVQSGSNKILKSMNRKHTTEEYLTIINKLLDIKPNMKFSSDFIIGYPNETNEDFKETIKLMEEVKFINCYSFIFSARPGTPAFNLRKIDQDEAKNRLIEFQDIAEKIKKEYRKELINKTVSVLFENKMKDKKKYFGRDEYFNSVIVESDEDLIGQTKNITIVDGNQNTLFGKTTSKMDHSNYAA